MKDAIGGSLLLNMVVLFSSIIILFFAGIMAYSKAYKIKNRIIEEIEKHAGYDSNVVLEINNDLDNAGYRVATRQQVRSKCGTNNLNESEYFYCVYLKSCGEYDEFNNCIGQRHYEVITYVHFQFPVIGDLLTFPVRGETRILGKNYNY